MKTLGFVLFWFVGYGKFDLWRHKLKKKWLENIQTIFIFGKLDVKYS